MQEVVKFFWEQSRRAYQMDEASRLQNKETPSIFEVERWVDAYKSTLSNNQKDKFNKAWQKLDKELETYWNDVKGKVKSPYGS